MGKVTGYIVEYSAPEALDRSVAGGKLAGLANLTRAGARVPAGFGVSAAAYRRWLHDGGVAARVTELVGRRAAAGHQDSTDVDELSRQLDAIPMPEAVAAEIGDRYNRLAAAMAVPDLAVAVRSSATAEDADGVSFAGEFETYLDVHGADAVCQQVLACWKSVFAGRAVAYAETQAVNPAGIDMAVVVQAMVPAAKAGVMFTLSPVSGDRSRIVIEGSWGLGTAVVGGEVTPDRYVVDKVSLEVVALEVSDKTVEHRSGAGPVPVDEARRRLRCLDDAEVRELAAIGKQLERQEGRPLDIEWAVDPRRGFPDSVVLLQCRPETRWGARQRAPAFDASSNVMGWITTNMLPRAMRGPSGRGEEPNHG